MRSEFTLEKHFCLYFLSKLFICLGFLLLTSKINTATAQASPCGLDIFVVNDQSGSIDLVENEQSRAFLSVLGNRIGALGTDNASSRIALSEFAHYSTWYRYAFSGAGANYTSDLSDVYLYEQGQRVLTGGTSIYGALNDAEIAIESNYISGRTVPKVVVLMTDAYCSQIEGFSIEKAQQLKNKGYYIVVMAIGPAISCTDLQTIASTNGYFSATGYQTLENNATAIVDNIFSNTCTNAAAFVPAYDLSASLTAFTATGCTPGPGTYTANYTITNSGDADFSANLKVAFYDAHPSSPIANHIITQDAGSQSITGGGGTYNGTLNSALLASVNQLYAVANIDGSLTVNTPPLSYTLTTSQLNENTEKISNNNFSGSIYRSDAGTCAPQARLYTSVTNTGILCDDEVSYEVSTCNTGNSTAAIATTIFAGTGFTLSSTDTINKPGLSPFIEWQKSYGGSAIDNLQMIKQSSDGGYFVAGGSTSGISGDKTDASNGDYDYWVMKLNSTGDITWQNGIGGSGLDFLFDLDVTSDNGCIIGGYSASGISGDKTEASQGGNDIWVVKLNSSGTIQWQNNIGGSGSDNLKTVKQTSDGGYILAGSSDSGISGDKTEASQGTTDLWIIKLNSSGTIVWQNTIGGAGSDFGSAINQTSDGGYILGAHSYSGISGDKTEAAIGARDYWILKLNSTGNIVWQNTIGGTGDEAIGNIIQTSDGGYAIAGYSSSDANGDKTENSRGGSDYWILKLNSTGSIVWQKTLGGSYGDFAYKINEDSNGNLLIAGNSTSGLDGDKTEDSYGNYDGWLIKLSSTGTLIWQKAFGGTEAETSRVLTENSDGSLIFGSYSASGVSGNKTSVSQGDTDYWITKLRESASLAPDECMTVQYNYDVSGVTAGNYDYSVGLVATKEFTSDQDPLISPNNSFTVGVNTGLNGFNGASHTSDDLAVATSSACPGGDLFSIALDIPDITVCEDGFTKATITITNNSGGTFNNIDLNLSLSGTGTTFASEPYSLTNGLVFPSVDINNSTYPSVDNALKGNTSKTLDIYTLPNGTSTFAIDLQIGTGLANLSAQLINIPTGYNTSNVSNTATDGTGITGEANPTISGNCPLFFHNLLETNSILSTVTGASAMTWTSGTGGAFTDPNSANTNYTLSPTDIANGYVDFSLYATSTGGCETVHQCRADISEAFLAITYDYGDAPSTYDLNQTAINGAAASTLLSNLHLGTVAPDTETTSTANAGATGDGAEDDALNGLSIDRPAAGSTGFLLPVQVTNSSTSLAYLTAYIDWNSDGDFLDTLEQSTQVSIPASSGTASYNSSFNIPNISIANDLYIRLRLSTDSDAILNPYGPAPQGEVEDILFSFVDPCGVFLTEQLWLKADAGVTGTTAVSAWADQSGNSNDAAQAYGPYQPALTDGAFNFNPAITLDGSNDKLNTTLSINYSTMPDATIISIYRPHIDAAGGVWGEENGSYDRAIWDYSAGTYNNYVSAGGTSNNNINNLYVSEQISLTTVVYDQGVSNGSNVYVNGVNERTFTANQAGASDNFTIGSLGGNFFPFDGEIAEVFVFNTTLNTTDRQKVESYLALKYGQTLSSNYLSSIYDGTGSGTQLNPVWDATANAAYQNGIAGIARDDCSSLDQRQSKSSNSDAIVEIYNGDVTSSIPSTNTANTNTFSVDRSFLIWGHNASAATYGTVYTPNSFTPPTTYYRMDRIWKVAENGTVGTVTVRAPQSAEHLLIHSSADFSTGTPTEIALVSDGNNGMVATVDFTNGQFFTFGNTPNSPGCLGTNLRFWLKADAGVTGTTNVSVWTDQSINSFSAAQSSASQQPAKTDNALNFNPAVTFDGSNSLTVLNGIFGTATYNDLNIYAVTIPVSGNSALLNESFASNDLRIYMPLASSTSMYVNGSSLSRPYYNYAANVHSYHYSTTSNPFGYNRSITGSGSNSPNTSSASAFTGNNNNLYIGSQYGSSYYMDGAIAEIIVYPVNMSLTEHHKVGSYLGIKYGISHFHNYVASDYDGTGSGTQLNPIWTYSNTWRYNLAGIGRDDCSTLDQRQSKNAETGSIIEIYNGNVTSAFPTTNAANTNAFSADKSFLLWSNNNGSTTSYSTNIYSSTSNLRITRLWQVEEVGTVDTVTLRVLKSSLPETTNYYLYVNSNSDNTFPEGVNTKRIELIDDGTYLYATVDFSDNDLFSLGTPDEDTDKDGVPDVTDIDDDNDGRLDATECASSAASFTGGQTGTLTAGSVTANYAIVQNSSSGYSGVTYTTTAEGLLIDNQAMAGGGDAFSYTINLTNITPGYTPVIRLYQTINTSTGNMDASDLTLNWTGGAGGAHFSDQATPSTSMYTSGVPSGFNTNERQMDGVFTRASVFNGETHRVFQINNADAEWYIEYPRGATSATVLKTTLAGGTSSTEGIDARYPTLGYGSNAAGESGQEMITFTISFISDKDNDGIADCLDLDADNDGIPDVIEAGGVDIQGDGRVDYSSLTDPTSMTDLDGDGLFDTYDDTDSGGSTPGWTNGTALPDLDSDGDGIVDALDLDSDNDGIPDLVEAAGIDMNGDGYVDTTTDIDGDGYADIYDPDDDGTPGIDNSESYVPLIKTNSSGNEVKGGFWAIYPDTDGDGKPNRIDLDADNDGIPDLVEAGGIDTNGDGRVDILTDADNDGFSDIYDPDDDGTIGVEDATDPLQMTGGTDRYNDGKTNDGGFSTYIDGSGNSNDKDGDDYPDNMDLDADNDGIPDLVEVGGIDIKGDGRVDIAALPWDADEDGLADIYDENANDGPGGTGTNGTALIETSADTNSDGQVNSTETMTAGNTNNINADGDALPNHLDLDADNDGLVDVIEAGGSDSDGNGIIDNGSGSLVDTDEDGLADGVDGDVGNDYTFENTASSLLLAATDGVDSNTRLEYSGAVRADQDGDDVPDFLDIDADNDGIYDNYEAQTTAGYVSPGTTDSDSDGILDAYEQAGTIGSYGGRGIDSNNSGVGSGHDHDSDGTPDYLDLDTDGDNIPDKQETWDNMVDGDSQEDNVSNCNGLDADGDGLQDCFDSNDSDPLVFSWQANPADDVDGSNSGTLFTDNLDVLLPDNGGNNTSEPDFRDALTNCSTAKVYYGISEASVGTTTDYEYNGSIHVDGAGTYIIRATTYCEPDVDGWYYYYNPLETENYLFAIRYNTSPAPVLPMWDIIDYIEIKKEPTPSNRYKVGATEATLVMDRDWNVVFKGTPTSGSTFDIKYYFQPSEMAALDAVADSIQALAIGTVNRTFQWFKKTGGLSNNDITVSGIASMEDITTNDPDNINELNPGNTDGSAVTTGNGKNYVTFQNLSTFSGGTAVIRITYTALPVELSHFSGQANACATTLKWIAESEESFSHYEVERSTDGRTFQYLASINAQGGLFTQDYFYTDDQFEKSLQYYRLKLVDEDGSFTYSKVIAVQSNCDGLSKVILYPNPVSKEISTLNLSILSLQEQEVEAYIVDASGRKIKTIQFRLEKGNNSIRWDVSDLIPMAYQVILESKNAPPRAIPFIKVDE